MDSKNAYLSVGNTFLIYHLKHYKTHLIFVKNVHVEVLYQRYFLRMNQNNMTSLLILLVIIATTMIVVNYAISSADSIMQVRHIFN